MKRFLIYDLRKNQTIMTGDLRTKTLARKARRELIELTGEPTRFIAIPGPDHKKWHAESAPSPEINGN